LYSAYRSKESLGVCAGLLQNAFETRW